MKCEHVGELGKSWQLHCSDDATKLVTVGVDCGNSGYVALMMTEHRLCGKHGQELFLKHRGTYAKVSDLKG